MPRLHVDIDAIGRNTEAVAAMLRRHRLDLVGVTKGCLGEPRVAEAMLAGGAVALADSRDLNLRRLRSALPEAELHRIYLPPVRGAFEPGDVTYISSAAGARAVAALATGDMSVSAPRKVMLCVDTGDEREGVPVDEVLEVAEAVASVDSVELVGVATNYACFRGQPAGIRGSLETVVAAASVLRSHDRPVARVSGGNSSVLWLIARGEVLPDGLTELRCGEALLLGQDALHYQPILGCRTDACILRAEVLEGYTRPTRAGRVRRLVLSLGRQDLGSGVVKFLEPGLREVGRSADYLVVETSTSRGHAVGDTVDMVPTYEALVAAWTSPYIELELS